MIAVGLSDPLVGLAEAALALYRGDVLAAAAVDEGLGACAVAADLREAAGALRAAGAAVWVQRPAWRDPPGTAGALAARGLVAALGAVDQPLVLRPAPGLRVGDLAERAGWPARGPAPAWLAGGALRGRPARPWEPVVPGTAYVALPPGHGLLRRLERDPAWELRAMASLCGNCRLCTEACTAGAEPHRLLRAPAGALAPCDGCGLCGTACPSGLQPHRAALALAAGARSGPAGPAPGSDPNPWSAGAPGASVPAGTRPAAPPSGRTPSRQALLARLGLLAYAGRPVKVAD